MSWKTVPFGSVSTLVNGKAFKSSDWSPSGIPIIRIQNLNDSDKPFNYWAGSLDNHVPVKKGDLLLAWSGTPGTSFGAHIWYGGNSILNQHIFRCDLDLNSVIPEWAKFAVNIRLDRLIDLAHGGVGLKHVTKGIVENLEIPLPPLAEQWRIAAILDQAEALRAKRRHALAQLDTLIQSFFLDLFGDPVANAKGWSTAFLNDLLAMPLRNGLSPSNSGGVKAKVLTLSAITGAAFREDAWKEAPFQSVLPLDQRVDASDLLICRGNGNVRLVGKGYFPPCDMPDLTFPDTMIAARVSGDRIAPGFLQVLWNGSSVRRQIESLARTTNGTFKINQTMLESIRFIAPPLALQHEFAAQVSAVERLKASQRASLAKLDALFASLQHRAFRGDL